MKNAAGKCEAPRRDTSFFLICSCAMHEAPKIRAVRDGSALGAVFKATGSTASQRYIGMRKLANHTDCMISTVACVKLQKRNCWAVDHREGAKSSIISTGNVVSDEGCSRWNHACNQLHPAADNEPFGGVQQSYHCSACSYDRCYTRGHHIIANPQNNQDCQILPLRCA